MPTTVYSELIRSPEFQKLKSALIAHIENASKKITGVRPSPSESKVKEEYQTLLKDFGTHRGRPLHYPLVASGIGNGPLVELADGSIKYDMIMGIGVNFFGHSPSTLMDAMIDAIPSDSMQGNLAPGTDNLELLKSLLGRVGNGCRIKHGWLTTCGTMANEIALKLIRQKRAPATRMFAFKQCFAGRSTAMQELTDNPKYREGQPVYGEFTHLPFYDSQKGLEASLADTLGQMKEQLYRFPDKYAGLVIELVQGEGGFNYAPREFYVRLFEEAKKANLAIWADEVQTFGRLGELFAYQYFNLESYVDVVTVGKLLQVAATLYTEEYNPKAGLVAGTFTGSSTSLRAAKRVVEVLCDNDHLGETGKITRLSKYFAKKLDQLANGNCKGLMGVRRIIGGMVAFAPLNGTADDVKNVANKLFDLGVIAFSCGRDPYLIRMLPPLVAMTEEHIDDVCGIIEQALKACGTAK